MHFLSDNLKDEFGRRINYLRVSITDLCNLRCYYCMPLNGVKKLPREDILRYEEFLEVVEIAASLGVSKMRITGGEPLVKRGAVKLVREIASLPGVKTVAMTTNGTRLAKYAEILKDVGLDRINVSLDTLDAKKFKRITGGGELSDVLAGIDKAVEVGFPIKINTVLMTTSYIEDIFDLVNFASEKKVELRFIERMSFEEDLPFVSQDKVLETLKRCFEVKEMPLVEDSPHVQLYSCNGISVGFISPRSLPFCSQCNKLRLTPEGELRACLASQSSVDLRSILRRPHSRLDIVRAFLEAVYMKPQTGPWTARAEMWRIGG